MDSGTSNSEPIAANRTTGKLHSENAANKASASPINSGGQAQTQTPGSAESLKLTVIEGFQVGRGVARIDPGDMVRLGCQSGDTVMITGARTTAAKAVPTTMIDRGQQTIQMDSQVR